MGFVLFFTCTSVSLATWQTKTRTDTTRTIQGCINVTLGSAFAIQIAIVERRIVDNSYFYQERDFVLS